MTMRQAIARAAERLSVSEHLRADAYRDAALLLQHLLGLTRAQLLADPDGQLSPEQYAAYQTLISRRLTHEPIQYITGEQEFFGLSMRVTPAVLIPRPETEHLVEAVLTEVNPNVALRIVDIGTGSGAIAVALATHLAHADVIATDISSVALEVAEGNAALNDVASRVRLVESDLFEGIASDGPFDVVVSNPPYIAFAEGRDMHPQVRDFEPATALFATGNGLDVYRRLIPQAYETLRPGGLLALEIGFGQREPIAAILQDWTAVQFKLDLQQIPRVALARKPQSQSFLP